MELRRLNIGCFGGGTGLPSLLGGLKSNPWLNVNAVVTMFDSGGSSGQLRDELGVLPPGDVLKCALALARNEREARRVLLSRLPMLEHSRLRGHTGGNLLLSMMEQYSGDFLAARRRAACAARVRRSCLASQRGKGEHVRRIRRRCQVARRSGGRRRADRRQRHCAPLARAGGAASPGGRGREIPRFEAAIIGPGSFYTSLLPIFLVQGAPEAIRQVNGPVILVTNLLTEGRGMSNFTAGDAVAAMSEAIGRPIDVVRRQHGQPVGRYAGPLSRRA